MKKQGFSVVIKIILKSVENTASIIFTNASFFSLIFQHIKRSALVIIWLTGGSIFTEIFAKRYTTNVDPFIGTENGGNVFVGACVPFGMVKLGPDCGTQHNNSGYYANEDIQGFSHTHVSGTGGGAKYGNILMMPVSGAWQPEKIASSRKEEFAAPGYYAAFLNRYKVQASLTSTHSVGLHSYTFGKAEEHTITINAGHFLEMGKEWGESQELVGSEVRIVSNKAIEGYTRIKGGWNMGKAYTVYFYALFDQPAVSSGTWNNGKKQPAQTEQWDSGAKTGAWFSFGNQPGQQVKVKVGISFLSVGKAKWNAENETPGWDFVQYRQRADEQWNKALSKVQVEGGSTAYKKMLYTGLYHSMLMPVNRTGENPGWKSTEPYYDDFYAIWDTYRTTGPLLTLLFPEVQRDIIRSMIDIYKNDGYMPDARSGNDNGRTQGGSNSDMMIADAYVKGLKGIDYEVALQAMIRNAELPPGGDERKEGRGGIVDYNTLGYVSTDFERAGTRTVEYAACDHAIATVAKGLGKPALYEKYLKRSENWRNLWRPIESYGAKGFIWPKNKDGSWVEDFNTLQAGSWKDFFYESHSWELSLYVPHNMQGLIEASGGKDAFNSRLDTFFIKSKPNKYGWMDFYNVNNEPGFLAPMLYHYIGLPQKSRQQIRNILQQYFSAARDGLPGNDDAGAMSSWLVFHLLGFFPMAGQDLYLIGTPHFDKVSIQLGENKTLEIQAKGFDKDKSVISRVTINGKEIDSRWFRHSDIAAGGTIVLYAE